MCSKTKRKKIEYKFVKFTKLSKGGKKLYKNTDNI